MGPDATLETRTMNVVDSKSPPTEFIPQPLKQKARRLLKKAPFTLAAMLYFWFYLAYPYRPLIDDGRYSKILTGLIWNIGSDFFRPIHHGLLYLQGKIGVNAMDKSILVSIALHLLLIYLINQTIILKLPGKIARLTGNLGLIAFIFHPAALQSLVHVSERAEILGAIFAALSIGLFLKARKLTRPKDAKKQEIHFLIITACGALAFLSKESYALFPLTCLFALSFSSIKRTLERINKIPLAYAASLIGFMAIMLVPLSQHFQNEFAQTPDSFRRTEVFLQSVRQDQEIAAQDSINFPLLSRPKNFVFQTHLIPKIIQTTFWPFAVSKSFGFFPYGRTTKKVDQYYLLGGVGILALFGLLMTAIIVTKRIKLDLWIISLSPSLSFGVYWFFPAGDPMTLHRLFGFVLFTFVLTVPLLLNAIIGQRSGNSDLLQTKNFFILRKWVPIGMGLFLMGTCVIAGSIRAWEMLDPVRQAELDLARQPLNYRLHLSRVRTLVAASSPLECDRYLRPVLHLAPTTAFVYAEWFACLSKQGKTEQARFYARKSLEQQSVPVLIQNAISLQLSKNGEMEVPLDKIHPYNQKIMFSHKSDPNVLGPPTVLKGDVK